MDVSTRIKLQSFNGTLMAPLGTQPSDNYWLLVGSTGTIHSFNQKLQRYLITLDNSVLSLGLHCHNPVPNSLYILATDLALIHGQAEA
jgi:hypothetical protein